MWRRLVMVISLGGLVLVGVVRAEDALPAAPAAPPDARPTPDAARAGARSWLGALRDKMPERMAKFSAFPIAVEGILAKSGPEAKKCRLVQSAKDAKTLDGVAKCLFAAKEFMEDIPADLALAQWKVIDVTEIPGAFERKRDRIAALAKDHQLVQVELTGEALNYTLLLAVKKAGPATAVSLVVAESKKPD